MNNMIFIIGIIILILVILILTRKPKKLEHLTQSNEALQNLASLYNKDAMTIGNITALNQMNVGKTGIVMNSKTGKADLYIDGDVHVNGNIYMNPQLTAQGSGAIVFNDQLIKSFDKSHLGTFLVSNGNALFLSRYDGAIFGTAFNTPLGTWIPHNTQLKTFQQSPI